VADLPGNTRVQDISPRGQILITNDKISAGIRGRAPGESTERDLTWLDWSIPAAISTDGRMLLFDEQGEGGGQHYAACLRGMDGSPPIRLGEGGAADLSSDQKWALAVRFWVQPPEIVLLPTGAGQPRTLPLTKLENISNAQFLAPKGDLLLVGNEPGRAARCYVLGADGGAVRPITPEGIIARSGCASPDGKWVAGLERGGALLLYPIDGGPTRPVHGSLPGEAVIGWSGDGKSVYLVMPGTRPAEVFRLDLAIGTRTKWATFDGPEDRAGMFTGAMVLGHDDHGYAYAYSRYLSELYLATGLR
jgi:hypothetical protein